MEGVGYDRDALAGDVVCEVYGNDDVTIHVAVHKEGGHAGVVLGVTVENLGGIRWVG